MPAKRFVSATPAEIIRMEANFLQFPFFALDTHGLRDHDGLTCTAERRIGAERHEVTVRITRNNAYAFPGPLSRKIHFALLAKLQEEQRHPPFRNPVTWSWYELADRIGQKRCSGGDIRQMKDAIESTQSAYIKTRYSLSHTEESANALRKRECGYHLYERCVFSEEPLPDGTIADTNYLWLSDWYLANLNNQYCGPLDYGRWLFLNNESRIASRLYEYLTYNFSAGMPLFRIRYERLAQFLPVTVFSSLSRARQQLEPALRLLQRQFVIESFRFERGSTGSLLLIFEPGAVLQHGDRSSRLQKESDPASLLQRGNEAGKVESERVVKLVRSFYEQWIDSADVTPSAKEIDLARAQIKAFGDRTEELLKSVVRIMRRKFPDAQAFGATRSYWGQADAVSRKDRVRKADKAQASIEQEEEEQKLAEQREWKRRMRELWTTAGEEVRSQVIADVRANSTSNYVRQAIDKGRLDDSLVELAIFRELEKSQSAGT